jgi:hypothetical protein
VDIVIDNNGDLAALAREVDSLADALLRSTDGDAGPSGACRAKGWNVETQEMRRRIESMTEQLDHLRRYL